MLIPLLVIPGVVVLVIVIMAAMYNSLVAAKKMVENAWSQIDVQLKRRYDLIPNLLETVKGYAKHEAGVMEKVTEYRSAAMQVPSGDTGAKIAAENQLTGAIKGLMVQMEAYPDLKANTNFLALQEELTSTENKISFARQHYNDTAKNYNTAIALFPKNIIANIFNFRTSELWQITDATERQVPKIQF